jgi:hypothetical protein
MEKFVNERCGLLGVSGSTSDMKALLSMRDRDSRAADAVELFCYQAAKWIGAFAAALGGLETLVLQRRDRRALGRGSARDLQPPGVSRRRCRRRFERNARGGDIGCPERGFRARHSDGRGNRDRANRLGNSGEVMTTTDAMAAPPVAPELLARMDAYWRAANYLSVGQIYLLDNPLPSRPLAPEHVKPRLLGHWGRPRARTSSTST